FHKYIFSLNFYHFLSMHSSEEQLETAQMLQRSVTDILFLKRSLLWQNIYIILTLTEKVTFLAILKPHLLCLIFLNVCLVFQNHLDVSILFFLYLTIYF